MLKTSSTKLAKPRKGWVGVGGKSKARRNSKCKLVGNRIGDSKVHSSEVENNEIGKKSPKMTKSKNLFKSKKLSKLKKIVRLDFFTPKARLVFTELRQTFIEAPILHHLDLKCYIQVETDISGYAISEVSSQLILEGQWHLMNFFFCKMISIETRYKTYNSELLAIIETFKTWEHYLESL